MQLKSSDIPNIEMCEPSKMATFVTMCTWARVMIVMPPHTPSSISIQGNIHLEFHFTEPSQVARSIPEQQTPGYPSARSVRRLVQ